MKLTENFTLEELTFSATAKIRGIDNTPDENQKQQLQLLCTKILQPIRTKFNRPISVTSGFRSSALNAAVRGSKTSQHLKGEAADIVCANNKELWNLICNMIIRQEIFVGQLIDEKNLSWIHISLPDSRHLNHFLHL